MASGYSGPGGTVKINPPNLTRLINQVVKAVVRGAQQGGKRSLYDIREMIQNGIRDNSLNLNPLKESTQIARANPPPGRPRSTRTQPLLYSGETLRGIKVTLSNTMLTLGFDPASMITYTRGNMLKVASNQEHGFTIKGTYTKKQLAYLHILFKKQFGEKAAKQRDFVRNKGWAGAGREGVKVGVAYSRTVDPRPAWERATLKSIPIVEINFRTSIVDSLTKAGLT